MTDASGLHLDLTHPAPAGGEAARPSVVTVGNFDGVHLGHQELVREARRLADTMDADVLVLSFDPHPASVLRPGTQPPRLSGFDRRRDWLLKAGADRVEPLVPDKELLARTPKAFVDMLVERYAMVGMVEGHDFHFGKDRAGTPQTLRDLSASMGFELRVLTTPITAELNDQSVVTASSSMARWLIEHGRVGDAARVLGRPYELRGTVVRGDRRGRSIGFPTANLSTDQQLPANGVYAGVGILPDGTRMTAAVNVGERPTFGATDRRVEVHLLCPGRGQHAPEPWAPLPDLPEYGWTLGLELHGFVRDQVRFAGVSALCAQLSRDTARVSRMLSAAETNTQSHGQPAGIQPSGTDSTIDPVSTPPRPPHAERSSRLASAPEHR